MPLKLPGVLKNRLHKNKSGTKGVSQHGGSAKHATATLESPSNLAMSPLRQQSQIQPLQQQEVEEVSTGGELKSGPSRTSPKDNALISERAEERSDVHHPETVKQVSVTSDYKSLTPSSSVASQISAQPVESGSGEPSEEALPDLMRSLDVDNVDGLLSSDASSSSDSGVREEYPTVIMRQRPPSDPSPEKTASAAQETKERSSPEGADPSAHQGASLVSSKSSGVSSAEAGPSSPSPGPPAKWGKGSSATAPVSSKKCPPEVPVSSATAPVLRADEAEGARAAAVAVPAVAGCARAVVAEVEMEVDGEAFPAVALETPIGALRQSRKRLCMMLNIEQPDVDTGWTPDYMGLADMLGFEALEIQNFWERNPADSLFMEWCRCHDGRLRRPVLATLLECLERLGRQDIIMDCRGLIMEDVSDYVAEKRLLEMYTVSRLQKFDCYVNIAEQDLLGVGRDILQNLEGVHQLRLCLTLRDVTLGGFEFEEMAKMLETRCDSKVLIVLTKSYEDSDACQFLTQFAVTLDPGSRKSKLIPLLVDEDTYIPRVLRFLAMLNYHRDKRLGFLWPRLKHAITSATAPPARPKI